MASMTSTLYQLARFSASCRAIRRGPKAVARLAVRRGVYRQEFRATSRVMRKTGL